MVALKRAASELTVTGMLAGIVIVISSMGLYYAEHQAQPEAYSSIPAAMWSAIVTLTTVGYGDVYPITPMGRILTTFIMLAGIGFVALPAGIMGSQLSNILQEREMRERDARERCLRETTDE